MKRFLFALVFVAFSACAFAQVTITSSNYYQEGAVARDVYTVENDATDSVSTANLLTTPLTFSNSLESQFGAYNMVDSVYYDGPATEGEFTEETCSFADENGMRMHLKVTDEKAVCLGVSGALAQLGLNDNIEVPFEEEMDVITFPAQLNSQTNSTAHGLYIEHISALQESFNEFGSYGPMIYQFVTAEYDSIMIDIQVTFSSEFDENGTLTLSGSRMMQGEYEYLREKRQYSYITNMYMQRNGEQEFTIISECTLTNPMFASFFGSETINLGEALEMMIGLSFPMTSTSVTLNYWRADDNYPIVEMSTNPSLTYSKRLAIRYEDHETSCDALENANVEIFPNPTTDFLNIAIEDMDNGIMNIYSTNGSLVKSVQLNDNHNSINVIDLHSGCYFFKIMYGDKEINGNFAKN
jgi:LEA14-like dessication related protein